MSFLKPIDDDGINLYRRMLRADMERVLDVLGHKKPSAGLLRELEKELGSKDAASMVAFAIRFEALEDEVEHAELRTNVHRLLRKSGRNLPPGKRNNPRMEVLVKKITPLLLYYGMPLARGEFSRLVQILRQIADEFNVPGDPRDQLRRIWRMQVHSQQAAKKAFFEAVVKGLRGY